MRVWHARAQALRERAAFFFIVARGPVPRNVERFMKHPQVSRTVTQVHVLHKGYVSVTTRLNFRVAQATYHTRDAAQSKTKKSRFHEIRRQLYSSH